MSTFNDTDELELHGRRSAAAAQDRSTAEMDHASTSADREVTLNTGTVMALFFALSLLCAVFFGLGYSMGRKSTVSTATADSSTSSPSADNTSSVPAAYKPAPGSPAIQAVPGYMSQTEANTSNDKAGTQSYKPPVSASRVEAASTRNATVPMDDAPPVRKPAPVERVAPPVAPAAIAAPVVTYNSAVPASASLPGITYVQIAAVSHQEDADVLLSALKRRGYKVLTRSDVGDKLIHVQIGPFANRKDAEATRQKLLSDGYNAFLK